MHRQTLKDAQNRIIGYIDTARDGRQTARDAQFHTVGYYDPQFQHHQEPCIPNGRSWQLAAFANCMTHTLSQHIARHDRPRLPDERCARPILSSG